MTTLTDLITGNGPPPAPPPQRGPDLNIVKQNIESMIQQGAPEADIDAYVASEGVTPEQLQAHNEPQFRRGDASAMFLQGATFGLGDEIVSGGAAGLRTIYDPRTGEWLSGDFGKKYDQQLAEERKLIEDTRADHPYASAGLEAAGGVTSALMPAGAITRGGSMVANTGRAIAAGSGMGAAYGFGSGEGGFEARTHNAIPSAVWGAVGGGASPIVGRALGASWNWLAGALNERGVGPQAVKKILGELQASGMTPQQAAQRLDEFGPEGMIADVNPGMQVMTGATATADTGAANIVSSRLGGRMQGAQQRIAQDLDATLGPPRDPYTQRQANLAQRSNISPQYEAALTNARPLPAELHDTLAAQLTNPASGLAKRNFMMGILNQIDDALSADTPELVARRLHSIRKDLDAQIVRDPRDFAMLSSSDKATQGAIKEARDAIDDVLKNRIPGFQEADEAFVPVARQQGAYEAGRNALRDRVSVGEHQANVQGYSRGERQYSNAGIRYDIEQRLDRPRQNAGLVADRILGSNAAQQKLETSIGRSGAARLRRGIDREETFLETSNLADARRNSRTAPLREAADRLWKRKRGISGLLGDIAGGAAAGGTVAGPAGAVAGALGVAGSRIRNRLADALSREDGELIRDTAERLTRRGRARADLVRELSDMAARLPRRARNASYLERLSVVLLLGTNGQTAPAVQRAGQAFGLAGQ